MMRNDPVHGAGNQVIGTRCTLESDPIWEI